MNVSLKKLLLNVMILCITSGCCVTIAEIFLRWYGITPLARQLQVYEFDNMLGWRIRPALKHFRSTCYYGHFNYYNTAGFPTTASDWNTPMDPKAPSIAFIGDSFTEGYYLPYESTFTYVVGKTLHEQIINLGVGGYAPDQYLLLARRHLPHYTVPTIIVMFFPHNDISSILSDTYQGYAKPLFGEDLQHPLNTPLPNPKYSVQQTSLVHNIAYSSSLYSAIRPFIKQLTSPEFLTKPVLYQKEHIHKAMALIKQISLEFPVERFIVYYIPAYNEISAGFIQQNLVLFYATCAELDVECFSLYDLMHAKEQQEIMRYYIKGDGHFSKQGAAAVADQLCQILTQTGKRI